MNAADASGASPAVRAPLEQKAAPASSPPQPDRVPDGIARVDSTPAEPTREPILAAFNRNKQERSRDETAPPTSQGLRPFVRHRDEWFIKFHGQVYGPYKTEREAMRFAIDAAYN